VTGCGVELPSMMASAVLAVADADGDADADAIADGALALLASAAVVVSVAAAVLVVAVVVIAAVAPVDDATACGATTDGEEAAHATTPIAAAATSAQSGHRSMDACARPHAGQRELDFPMSDEVIAARPRVNARVFGLRSIQ
jgi:hypothetical protein